MCWLVPTVCTLYLDVQIKETYESMCHLILIKKNVETNSVISDQASMHNTHLLLQCTGWWDSTCIIYVDQLKYETLHDFV